MRRTKIVATLGPSTDSPAVLDRIVASGVDVVRLNAAHSDIDGLEARMTAARAAAERAERHIGVLVDLPGPKVRVGEVAEGTVLEAGREFRLLSSECLGDQLRASVSYPGLAADLHPQDRLLLDDGRIELRVLDTAGGEVRAEVVTGGTLSSNKGVNAPDATLGVEAVTDRDRAVLAWAVESGADWIGQSFVRSASDVHELRAHMTAGRLPIVAKIEKHEATNEIEAIVSAADGVMVARGDLGVETSPERVPVLQREIVSLARAAGKPVVIATEMLDSMRDRARPTRAEASDVATAIFERADAVMLSGETAVGRYPAEAVATMARIATAAEEACAPAWAATGGRGLDDVQEAMSAAVAKLAADLDLAAIVSLTQSGATALAVARHRPKTPIVAATATEATARLLSLAWGVEAVVIPFSTDKTSVLLDRAAEAARDAGYATTGRRIAITAGLATRTPGGTDVVHVRTV